MRLVLVSLISVAVVCVFVGSAQALAAPARGTTVRVVDPLTTSGKLASGYAISRRVSGFCGPSRLTSGLLGCTIPHTRTANVLLDPCWALAPQQAVCSDPLSSRRLVLFRTKSALPPTHTSGKLVLDTPVEVQLTTGEHCFANPFMADTFRSHLVEYSCPAGLWLLDYANRSQAVWRFNTARAITTGPPLHYRYGTPVLVRTAWFAEGPN
jgi:hypothetical protein